MPQTTTDDQGQDQNQEDGPSSVLGDGAVQGPAAPAKKVHAPRLDQHGEAGTDSPTAPDKDAHGGENPEASTSDEGA